MSIPPKAPLAKCGECPLFPYDFALGQGPEQSDLVFVGEAPGKTEIETGKPFTGLSGELISKTIQLHGQDFYSYHITNACLCRPPDNADPPPEAIDACQDRLIYEIRGRKPKVIVLMGNHAIKAVMGKEMDGVMSLRGTPIWSDDFDCWIYPLIHPAAILYTPQLFNQFERDIAKLFRVVNWKRGKQIGPPPTQVDVAQSVSEAFEYLFLLAYKTRPVEISWDLETEGLDPHRGWILCLQLSHKPGHAYVIPDHILYTDIENRIPNRTVVNALKFVLMNPNISVLGQNLKFDVSWAEEHLGILVKIGFDTILANHQGNSTPGLQSIESIADRLLDCEPWSAHLAKSLPSKKANYSKAPRDILYKYGGRDTDITLQVKYKLAEVKGSFLYDEILLPAARQLQRAESRGILLDTEVCSRISTELTADLTSYASRLYELAKHEFNPNSPQQVAKILFDEMNLFVPKNINQNKPRSTNRQVLQWLADSRGNLFAEQLINYRKKSKLITTYVNKMPKIANDNVIRSSFNLTGTITGRLSSSDPNLQNIPKDSSIRDMFVARSGYVFVEADFSQAELRWLADISSDKNMLKLFENDENDPHGETARQIYGDAFTSAERSKAKTLNFAVVYGISAKSLAIKYDMTTWEAQQMMDGWHKSFPEASSWMKEQQESAINGHPIKSPFGRQWTFGLVTDRTENSIMRDAVNYPIQSAASELCTLNGIVRTSRAIRHLDAHLLVPVHDSCLFEVVEKNLDEVVDIIQETMVQSLPGMTVRFKVDVNTGKSWGSLN